MQNQIIFASGQAFDLADLAKNNRIHRADHTREWRQLRIVATPAEAAAAFVDGAEYLHDWDSSCTVAVCDADGEQVFDENGEPLTQGVIEIMHQDLSEYSIAGEIVDHRDGTVTVYMGKPTEMEILRALLQTANQAIAGEITPEEYQAAALAKGEDIGEIGIIKDKGKS